MKDLESVPHNSVSERLVEIISQKTQVNNQLGFRIMVGYYFTKVASMMRAKIATHDRGMIPVNMYAINLATSGQGKGHSTNIVEEMVINQFRDRFLEQTFPLLSETSLGKLAVKRAAKKNADPDAELIITTKEFENLGSLAFSFDSGTTAAVKQMRHKLLMSGAGSMNLEMDEIGSNLMGNTDVLTTYLELFDVGNVKPKLTKNTADNTRNEEIVGRTPTNMMLFGTPSKLLNGGKTEEEFVTMLETGYGRRCFFGLSQVSDKDTSLSPQEIYDKLTDKTADVDLLAMSNNLGKLADGVNFNKTLAMTKDVSLLLIEYKLDCEKRANRMPEHQEIQKAEINHRYFKALKLAGTYAFIEGSPEVTEDHLYSAIRLAEESGEAFNKILTRERNYVKLARYISSVDREVTFVDMVEDLPFYKGTESQKKEMLNLAIAYGYKNNIIIKKLFNDGIEFLKGESLDETDLDKMVISYGTELAHNYKCEQVKFTDLHKLTQAQGYHWVSHHLADGHRLETNCIPGFNLLVLDIDDGVELATVQLLMRQYKHHIYTTKRHRATVDGITHGDRFRMVLPLTHVLKMSAEDYKEFMDNVYDWLPFDVDRSANQRSKKFLSHAGNSIYNDGKLVDALEFIPKTSKCEERRKVIDSQQSLSNVERWFVHNTGTGNRSNQLIKFALMLVDSGQSLEQVKTNVFALNSKLAERMEETEIMATIMVTASKAYYKRTSP